jgi:crotonobetainyl-CoA:carnitine CoA-transferase CaiB-like acyl-CoA transferase
MKMAGPLQGITVVDVTTNISGPSLTMILADLGAEIIKIERPDNGDDSRKMGPLWETDGVYYLYINRNKRSIVIDLKTDKGKEIIQDLIKKSDVFVENFRYGKANKLGFGYDDLNGLNPRLIYCSLSAYGQEGPRRDNPGYDAIVQADCGIMGLNGSEDGPIARAPVSVLDQGSAMWGALGIISALYHREKSGKGQKVETSLFETGVFWTGYHMLSYLATGQEPKKMGSNHAAFAPYGAYETADNPIIIGVSNDSLFKKVCRVLERQNWIDDVRFKDNVSRLKNRDELNLLMELILKTKPASYWIMELTEHGVPSSIIQKISDVTNDEQTKSLKMFNTIDHPEIGPLSLPRLPLTLSGSPIEIKKSPPLLGEDTLSILKENGFNDMTIQELLDKGIIQIHKEESERLTR